MPASTRGLEILAAEVLWLSDYRESNIQRCYFVRSTLLTPLDTPQLCITVRTHKNSVRYVPLTEQQHVKLILVWVDDFRWADTVSVDVDVEAIRKCWREYDFIEPD